jgi:ABC-type bacteriocin/lantibiotic exporter with double-glycine peptidase domain
VEPDPPGQAGRRHHVRPAVVSFKQRDATDCGPACLKYVAHRFGLRLPIPPLRQMMATGPAGSTVYALIEAAKALGFSAKGVKGPAEALPSVPLPAIAHVLMDRQRLHYVVLVDWTARRAKVMDPASAVSNAGPARNSRPSGPVCLSSWPRPSVSDRVTGPCLPGAGCGT